MPKVNLTSRKIYPAGTSSVVTRRKRFQLDKAKNQLDDEASSTSPFNELRFVREIFLHRISNLSFVEYIHLG